MGQAFISNVSVTSLPVDPSEEQPAPFGRQDACSRAVASARLMLWTAHLWRHSPRATAPTVTSVVRSPKMPYKEVLWELAPGSFDAGCIWLPKAAN